MAKNTEMDTEALNTEEVENQGKKGKKTYGKAKDTETGYYKVGLLGKVKYRDGEALQAVKIAAEDLKSDADTLAGAIGENGETPENINTLYGNVANKLGKLSSAIGTAIAKNDEQSDTDKISKKGDTAKIQNNARNLSSFFEKVRDEEQDQVLAFVSATKIDKTMNDSVKITSKFGSDALIFPQGKIVNEALISTKEAFKKVKKVLGIK